MFIDKVPSIAGMLVKMKKAQIIIPSASEIKDPEPHWENHPYSRFLLILKRRTKCIVQHHGPIAGMRKLWKLSLFKTPLIVRGNRFTVEIRSSILNKFIWTPWESPHKTSKPAMQTRWKAWHNRQKCQEVVEYQTVSKKCQNKNSPIIFAAFLQQKKNHNNNHIF